MVKIVECGIYSFQSNLQGKKLYCFGAGRYLQRYAEKSYYIQPFGIIDNYCAENEKKLHGEIVPVCTLGEFVREYDESCVVLVTMSSYEDAVSEMDGFDALDGMECYLMDFMEHSTEHFDLSRAQIFPHGKELIPRKIHYCWFGGSELSEKYQKNLDSWRKYCPDYEIIRWDETNYDVSKNAYMFQAYQHRMWSFVSDYARVDILHQEGGIYFDTDVEIIQSFDPFLSWSFFCGFQDYEYVNWGLGYGSVAQHPILKAVIKRYEKLEFVKNDGSFNLIACPIIQSEVMKEEHFLMNGKFQSRNEVAVYPKEFFSPFDYIRTFGQITESTHSIHHYAASWVNHDGQRWRRNIEQCANNIRHRKKVTRQVIQHNNGTNPDRHFMAGNQISQRRYFQIWDCLTAGTNAGSKAPYDVMEIAEGVGYQRIDIHPWHGEDIHSAVPWSRSRNTGDWEKCYHEISDRAIVLLQHPFWQMQPERNKVLRRLKDEKKIRVVSFVHDVEELRRAYYTDEMRREFHFMLEIADVFIVHSEAMKQFLVGKGVKPFHVLVLGIFDYLTKHAEIPHREYEKSVVIAGNLASGKGRYIEHLNEIPEVPFHLFGSGYHPSKTGSNVKYHGAFPAEKLVESLVGGFGLVWNGDSMETCDGDMGNYLRYNSPHKLSLYIAAGIPPIVWKESAAAAFVREHGIGLTISSLHELPAAVTNVTLEQYREFSAHLVPLSSTLMRGGFTKAALEKAEVLLDNGNL